MRTCKIENCGSKYLALGYCGKHYQKFKIYGDPLMTKTELHGMSGTQEYNTYHAMIQRCYYKKYKDYHRYGGRGIIVCESWKKSFVSFFADMGLKPFPKAQIDRIDNDGNYEPGNCRWVSNLENSRNASKAKLTIQKAREIRKLVSQKTNIELADLYDIDISSIRRIIKNQIWKEIMT